MKYRLSETPALKALLTAVPGAIVSYFYILPQTLLYYVAAIVFLSAIIVYIIGSKDDKRLYISAAYIAVCLTVGFIAGANFKYSQISRPDKVIPPQPAIAEGKVVKVLKIRAEFIRCIVEGKIDAQALPPINNQRFLLTIFSPKKENLKIYAGQEIIANAEIRPPRKANLPCEFDEARYYASIDAQWSATAKSEDVAVLSAPGGLERFREKVSRDIKSRVDAMFSEKTAGIAKALLVGDKTEIPEDTRRRFSLAGTAHLLAVSGLHVGVVAGVALILLGFVENRFLKFAAFTLLVGAFVFLSGLQPSAIRAGSIFALAYFASLFDRRIYPLNILFFFVLIALAFKPEAATSIGFQMSVGAVGGIIVFFEIFVRFFKRFIFNDKAGFLADLASNSLAATFSASFVAAPLVAYYFGVFSVVSPIANFFVVPLTSASLVFAGLGIAVSYVYFPAGELYASASDALIRWSNKINEIATSFDWAYAEGKTAFIIAIIVSIATAYVFLSDSRRLAAFRASVAAIAGVAAALIFSSYENSAAVRIYPRENVVVIESPLDDSTDFLFISDRRPSQYPKKDLGLIQYALERDKRLVVGINGNCGQNAVDVLKKLKNINYIYVSLDMQDSLQKIFNINNKIPKIYDYDEKYAN